MSPFGRGCGSHPGHNMETLKMSRKERDRLTIMAGVKEQELTLVQASELMGGVLPPEQAHLATVSGRRGRETGASAAGPAQRGGASRRRCGRWHWRAMKRSATPTLDRR